MLGDLIIGIVCSLFFVEGLVVNYLNIEWQHYFYFFNSIIYLGKYFYESHFQYLIITENQIIKPSLFDTQTIDITDIIHVKRLEGDIMLHTNDVKIRIEKNVIDPNSYLMLEEILDNLSPSSKPRYNNL